MSEAVELNLVVNGRARAVRVPPLRRLLDVLRDDLDLPGTKEGCGEGECGACSVLVDGELVNSCLVAACQVDGADVLTVESDDLGRVQQAFLDEGGAQCGICTPGMIVAAKWFADDCARRGVEPSNDDVRTALAGNLCRCTGYEKILASVRSAARRETP